jgi:hypothetical protein
MPDKAPKRPRDPAQLAKLIVDIATGEGAFGGDVDYAQLVKIYGASPESMIGRYSPAECTGARKERIEGNPDPKHISTSFAERLQKGREPCLVDGAVHDLLQFRPHPHDAAHIASDGGRRDGSAVGDW